MVQHIGEAEELALVGGLTRPGHHAHMVEEVAPQVEAREMHAHLETLHALEETRGDALGGLALVVAGHHAVDVGAVAHPEAPAHVHGGGVDAGDDHHEAARLHLAVGLDLAHLVDQTGADVGLLDLVAAHGTDEGDGLLEVRGINIRLAQAVPVGRYAEQEGAHRHGVAVGQVDVEEGLLEHALRLLCQVEDARDERPGIDNGVLAQGEE